MRLAHAWNLIGKKWLERGMDMGWRAQERELTRARLVVHGVTQSWTQLK